MDRRRHRDARQVAVYPDAELTEGKVHAVPVVGEKLRDQRRKGDARVAEPPAADYSDHEVDHATGYRPRRKGPPAGAPGEVPVGGVVDVEQGGDNQGEKD